MFWLYRFKRILVVSSLNFEAFVFGFKQFFCHLLMCFLVSIFSGASWKISKKIFYIFASFLFFVSMC